MVKAAINGFGRIGRLVFRAAQAYPDLDIIAVNDLSNPATMAHLLKYDSTHGIWDKDVTYGEDYLCVDGKKIRIFAEKEPGNLPWKDLGVELVIEASGKFNDATKACAHLEAGAKKVVLTAPGKNEDITIVMGVNEEKYDASKHNIISNASCTTNGLAPVAKVLDAAFGIKCGLMTTIHAVTNDQVILDKTHKDMRRARSAYGSIIPTTTGAAKAVALVLPQLKGKLNGFAMRVPTQNVSVIDLTVQFEKEGVSAADVNAALKAASEKELKGILGYTELPLVSCDYNGMNYSSMVDGLSTMMVGDMCKVLCWYDNEWGYSKRVCDLASYIMK